MNADDILNYNVKNSRGSWCRSRFAVSCADSGSLFFFFFFAVVLAVALFASIEWSKGPTQMRGFNYYPAVRISG